MSDTSAEQAAGALVSEEELKELEDVFDCKEGVLNRAWQEIRRLQPFEQRVAELERENREQKTTIRALQDKLIEMGRYVNDECEKKDAELADLRAKLAEREAECKEWEQELADAKSFWDLAEAKAKRWRDRYAELRSREGGEAT